MIQTVRPSGIHGEIKAPPSKSVMLRALAAALLSKSTTTIKNPSFCEDAMAGLNVVEKLGGNVVMGNDFVEIQGGLSPSGDCLNCNESGLCLRMFTPIATLCDQELTLTGEGSLADRPVAMVEFPLRQLGVHCITTDGFLPVIVKGPLKGGSAVLDGSTSSQFLTGLLMALPAVPYDSSLSVTNLRSKPYIDITLYLQKEFGVVIENRNYEVFKIRGGQHYSRNEYSIEGDWSGAAFLLVAGALSGHVTVTGLNLDSPQGDKKVLKALLAAGANVTCTDEKVAIVKDTLKAFTFDATHCPDLFPPLAALACFCRGTSFIHGVERLKYKESHRAQALEREFSALGADIKIVRNVMRVTGKMLSGGRVNSHNDHRIAMAAAAAGTAAAGAVSIENPQCVAKSYPGFFEALGSLGGDSDKTHE